MLSLLLWPIQKAPAGFIAAGAFSITNLVLSEMKWLKEYVELKDDTKS